MNSMNINLSNRYSLENKVAIITGGAGLLGKEHAAALLELGAIVIITDLNQDLLEQAVRILGKEYDETRIFARKMDVTDSSDIEVTRDHSLEEFGTIDILINNAAIDPKVGGDNPLIEQSRLEHFSVEDWDFQISVGLTGAFSCCKVFGQVMADNGQGVILNIASDLSVISPDQRLYRKEGVDEKHQPVKPVTYSVIKSGLIGLTRYVATYWANKGVRANALSPGGVYTNQNDTFVKKLTDLIPMGRMANRDEYRGAVQFLCSDASQYLNGQNIVMDGGRSIL
jgi:NAD(P)-dependent dehydrogenase (short-subunit alcohol dehydrogenase family)